MVVLQKEKIYQNDQNFAESNQFLDITKNLLNTIENINVQLNLNDKQIGKIESAKDINENTNKNF